MNSVIRPTGPESENTYWIRRGIVLAAALVSLALIWWVLAGLFGGGDEGPVSATPKNPASLAGPGATPSQSDTPSASASSTPSASATLSASATPSVTPTPTPSRPTTCSASDLKLSVQGEQQQKVGGAAKLSIGITNTGQSDCQLDLARTPISVEVTSGADRIWTTAHCPAWAPKGKTTLGAGKQWGASATWPVKRSAKDCTLRDDVLRPGTYRATAGLDGSASDTLVINLRG